MGDGGIILDGAACMPVIHGVFQTPLSVDNGQQTFPGGVSEVLIYNRALSEVERLKIEMYLMQKYEIH